MYFYFNSPARIRGYVNTIALLSHRRRSKHINNLRDIQSEEKPADHSEHAKTVKSAHRRKDLKHKVDTLLDLLICIVTACVAQSAKASDARAVGRGFEPRVRPIKIYIKIYLYVILYNCV